MSIDTDSASPGMPVAIVGIGMRFPANARTEAEVWEILSGGHCKIGEIPSERWPVHDLTHPDRNEPGRSVTFRAGVLERADEFDASFFGISPREAAWMDPQQRMLLEMAHDAMENAGIPPEELAGTQCGVYVGISGMDYGQNALTDLASMSPWTMTGNTLSIAANRISWVYNLHGPSLAIDTACSSSLAAIHQACQALRSGEIPLALAGGINVLMHPYAFIGFSHASMLSAKGECRPFDAGASGYVRGEGGALLLLKPLRKAMEDGDNIHAVILGTGINSDGSRKSGLTIPSAAAQTELMRDVLRKSGLTPDDLDFVEAHGTGTPVGDPVEASSIGQAYGRKRRAPLPISSAKANFGHLEPASGMAGMIKAILALKNRQLPPMPIDFQPNPAIPFSELNIFCAAGGHALKKESGKPLVGAVNSFGFGGLNAHAILSTAPPAAKAAQKDPAYPALFISASADSALRQLAGQYATLFEGANQEDFAELTRAAALGRDFLDRRLAVSASSPEKMAASLRAFANGENPPEAATISALPRSGGIAFIYSGNGSQWAGMGRQLLEEAEEFRAAIEMLDAEFLPVLGWSILEALLEADDEFMADTAHAQPLLFAVQAALTITLAKAGVRPDATAGHSVGEIAAAWAAGQLSLKEAIQIVFARSIAQGRTKGMGKMAAIGLGAAEAQALLEKAGLAESIEIAAANSPLNCTVSGQEAALDSLEELLAQDGVFFRKLDLDYAFHSQAMDQEKASLAAMLSGLQPRAADGTVFVSTVNAEIMRGNELDAEYWWQNMRHRVEFAKAIERLYADGMRVFVEIGPHAVLQRYIRENLAENASACRVLPLAQRENAGIARLRQMAATLHLLAGRRSMRKIFGPVASHAPLPLYPWQKERHTFPKTSERLPQPERKMPLLGWSMPGANPFWENILDPRKDGWLHDHKIGGSTVLAAASWLEIALEAGRAWLGGAQPGIENLAIELPLVFENDQPQTLRTSINASDGSFRILSRPRLADGQWIEHARGRIVSLPSMAAANDAPPLPEDASVMEGGDFYVLTKALDLEYGPFFRRIEKVRFAGRQLEASLKVPEESQFVLDPGAIDACFHSLAALYPDSSSESAYLPVGVEKTAVFSSSPAHFIRGSLRKVSRRTLKADFILYGADGEPVASMTGCRFRKLPVSRSAPHIASWKTTAELAPLPRNAAPECVANADRLLPDALAELKEPQEERVLWHRDVLQNLEAMAAIGLAKLEKKYGERLSSALPPSLAKWLRDLLPERESGEPADVLPDWREIWKEIHGAAPKWLMATLPLARLLDKLPALAEGRISLEELRVDLQDRPDSLAESHAHPAWQGAETLVAALARKIAAQLPPEDQLLILDYGSWSPLLGQILPDLPAAERISFHTAKNLEADNAPDGKKRQADLIIVRNMLHKSLNLAAALGDLFTSLQPGGLLILEERHPDWSAILTEGLNENWWRAGADGRALPALMGPEEWRTLLLASGFENIEVQIEPAAEGLLQGAFVILAQKPKQKENSAAVLEKQPGASWLLLAEEPQHELCELLAAMLEKRGQTVKIARLNDPGCLDADNIVLLPNAEIADLAALLERIRLIGLEARAERLWLATRGGALLPDLPGEYKASPPQAALTGFARVFNNESNGTAINAIDLDASFSPREAAERLAEEFLAPVSHEEASWTRLGRFQPRIVLKPDFTTKEDCERCRLDIPAPGKLDNLQWQPLADLPPRENEIEARIMASGLNFRDIMLTLGLLPEDALENGFAGAAPGLEFAGVVTRVGSAVDNFAPGDRIAGFASSSFSSHARTPATACAKIPGAMSFQEAASLPTIFVTAWYALHYLGRIAPGESILIHGGAGGVGLAAIQIAKQAGARVFATAGTNEKRDLLRLLGVELVADSRSLDFVEQILVATNGQGVDLVLNSLAGEAMRRSLRLLKPFGRFLELGKRDFVENTAIGLAPFKENISYFAIDIDQLQSGRPDLAGRLFAEIMERLNDGSLLAPPVNTFRADKIIAAFRAMQHSRHIGKIVVDMAELPKPRLPATAKKLHDLSGTWLITGGLSGFGLATAKHLAELGVKSLVLVSRQGKASPEYPAIKEYFGQLGIDLLVESRDVADSAQVNALIAEIRQKMPPLKGIVHAAAVFDDRFLADMNKEAFDKALNAKLMGAINLHEATIGLPLEHFILYSSISVALGNPGQANYVAANAGLEGLARKRIGMNLPASCVAWGPIGDCGYLGRNPKVRALLEKRIGARTLSTSEAMAEFDHYAAQDGVHIVGNADWSKIARQSAKIPERLSHVADSGSQMRMGNANWAEQMGALTKREAIGKIEACVSSETAKVLGLPVADVPVDRSLPSLGLDSLMAMELASGIEQSTGLRLPAMLMQDAPSIEQIAERLYARMMGNSAEEAESDAILDELARKHAENLAPEEKRDVLDSLRNKIK